MSNFLDRRFLNLSLSVLSVADSPAANPTAGNQYIVGSNPTGAFASAAANQIARYDGSAWSFVTPKAGELEVLNLDTAEILCFNGSAWSAVASFADNNDTSASHILTVKGVGLSEGNDPYLGLRILEEFVVKPLYSGASIERIYPADADRFASISDGKIYTYHEADSAFTANDVPEGQIIFDASSFLFYQHDSTNHSFTPIHRAVNLPAVSRIVDSFVFNADDINTVKNSHSTEGYSFAHSYGTIYTFTSGSWQEESFSVGTRFAASHYVNSSHALILQRINDRMDNFNEKSSLMRLIIPSTVMTRLIRLSSKLAELLRLQLHMNPSLRLAISFSLAQLFRLRVLRAISSSTLQTLNSILLRPLILGTQESLPPMAADMLPPLTSKFISLMARLCRLLLFRKVNHSSIKQIISYMSSATLSS